MKVSGLGAARGTVAKRGGSKAGAATGRFEIGAVGSGQGAAPATGVSGPAAVGALLSVQEASDQADERARGLAHGGDLLRELEQIRMGLLLGTIPKSQLERLTRLLRERRGAYADPRLNEIVAQIEVRAAVELAKFERTAMARA
jgi:hypothetical protein